jgi:hypothetical protein
VTADPRRAAPPALGAQEAAISTKGTDSQKPSPPPVTNTSNAEHPQTATPRIRG